MGAYTGGLVGQNECRGSISTSYATGIVTGSNYVGGRVGSKTANSAVVGSYATGGRRGAISLADWWAAITVAPCARAMRQGKYQARLFVGGLVGGNSGGPVSNSFWDTQTSGQGFIAGGTGMSTAEMKMLANFSSATSANGNVNPAWDFAAVWVIYEGYTSPLLRSFMTPVTVTASDAVKVYDGLAFSGGNGITCPGGACPGSHLFNTTGFPGTSQGAINPGSYVLLRMLPQARLPAHLPGRSQHGRSIVVAPGHHSQLQHGRPDLRHRARGEAMVPPTSLRTDL